MELNEEKMIAVTIQLPAGLLSSIDTMAEKMVRSRRGQIEFLLNNHPELGAENANNNG